MISSEKLRSPNWIFFLYMTASCVLIMVFRFFIPGSESPLIIFTTDWRLIQGLLELFDLFPALAFSALVVPFGIVSFEENYQSFSQAFFKRLAVSVIVAIFAAALYAVIFFLALPLAKDYEENLRFKGELYHLAKDHAQQRSKAGDWQEASQFIDICDRVWPNSPELANLRIEIEVNLNELRTKESEETSLARESLERNLRSANLSALSGDQHPVNATQALSMSEAAFKEKRYYDAHWLATLAGRLSSEGSPEEANAKRLASEAWNQIPSLAPSRREERFYSLYETKLSGYQAMNTGDWIRAYYIFQDLLTQTPDDIDVKNFFAASERGVKEYAFFIDEMDLSLGEILTGALFSLPGQNGRAALRFSNLSTTNDIAYGTGFEYMEFDLLSRPVLSMSAPYAKIRPVTLNNKPQVMVITHALSRNNEDLSWEGEWLIGKEPFNGVIMDVSFEDFLLISEVRHGLENLQIDQLFLASKKLGSAGYISQIFEAEVLNRLGSVIFFLPMAILVIVIGWRYRARTKPRYLFILLLPILPVVFHGFVFMYRVILNLLGICLVLSFGFSSALVIFIVVLAVCLFSSMIILASQHG
jgi:hypothetical protein